MNVALLISGYLRTFKDNIPNLKSQVLDKFENVDVYIHITKNSNKEDRYLNNDENLEYLNEILNPICLLNEDNFILSNDKVINNTLNLWLKYYKLNEIKKENEKNYGKYDLVIKYRPDLNIISNDVFTEDITKDLVYLPEDSKMDKDKLSNKGDMYICDIFSYGNSDIMDKYFEIYDKLNILTQKYKTGISETLLYHHLVDNSIDFKKIPIDYNMILSKCNVFAIAGDSGSGKTTLGNILKNYFSSSFLLECDRYHKWERGDDNWSKFTHLNTESNYLTKMSEDIFDLKIGNTIYQVDYDHKNGKFTEPEKIDSSDNIIMCGLHSLYSNDDGVYNLKIFVDTDDTLKYTWKIKRDMTKRGYTKDQVLKQIESRKKDYYEFVYPQRERSDIIVNFFTDSQEIDLDNEPTIFLRLLICDKYNIKDILNIFYEKEINFETKINGNFNEVVFYTFKKCNLIKNSTDSYYDYIIFFILSLKQ
jgi:uridine kinase